ncbi:MAG: hypothetical protein IK051_08890, partial [Rhodocyclaceae bacterium]|nr:hypothetical protein [Rhodocyclaceae bacterium]
LSAPQQTARAERLCASQTAAQQEVIQRAAASGIYRHLFFLVYIMPIMVLSPPVSGGRLWRSVLLAGWRRARMFII